MKIVERKREGERKNYIKMMEKEVKETREGSLLKRGPIRHFVGDEKGNFQI